MSGGEWDRCTRASLPAFSPTTGGRPLTGNAAAPPGDDQQDEHRVLMAEVRLLRSVLEQIYAVSIYPPQRGLAQGPRLVINGREIIALLAQVPGLVPMKESTPP